MDTIEQQAASDKKLHAQCEIIRASLDAIANDMVMRDVGLNSPIYFAMPD